MAKITVDELEQFFASVEIPETIQMNRAIKWSDVPEHVASYLQRLKTEPFGEFTTAPLYVRLIELKELLEKKAAE